MTEEKCAYAIEVKTIHDTYTRNYQTLDELINIIDAIKLGLHMTLLSICDAPIVIINSKDIKDIVISGATSQQILDHRQKKMMAEAEARHCAWESRKESEMHWNAGQSGLIGAGFIGNSMGLI